MGSWFWRGLIGLWLLGCGLLAAADNPLAPPEKRVALVIGNASYPGSPLKNPVNDARDMAAALRKLGFEVIERTNVGQKDMNRAITLFGSKLNGDSIALFYYAGHGMQVKGRNFLIPIDAQIDSEASVRSETVDVDALLEQLAQGSLNLVILDACRNNPFERRFRSTGGGLAQMEAPKGTLIAYATAPGKVASDGEGRNGLYTQELLKIIQTPGLEVEKAFKRVRASVARATGDAQIPWEASSLTGDFFFRRDGVAPPPAPPASGEAPARTDPAALELAFWESVQRSDATADYAAYLKTYPDGRFAALARNRLGPAETPLPGPEEGIAQPPLPKLGDYWRYRGSNNRGPDSPEYRVTRSDESGFTLSYNTNQNENIVVEHDREGNVTLETGRNMVGTLRFSPAVPQFRFPLTPGKRWSGRYHGACGPLCSFDVDAEYEVRGWEVVKVPAGSFRALRIEYRDEYHHAFGMNSTGLGTLWLAPEVLRPVKTRYVYSGNPYFDHELESFQQSR